MTSERSSRPRSKAALLALLGGSALSLGGCGRSEASDLATSAPVGQGVPLEALAADPDRDQPAASSPIDPPAGVAATVVSPAASKASEPHGPAADVEASVAEPEPESAQTSAPRPSGEPKLITFADLSLIGLDVDAIFDPAEDQAGLAALPETIRKLDRTLVALEGYMIPMEWEGTRVRAFMLVRDMAGCCFGQMPQPDEWVEVVMHDDEVADYYPYVPVLVTGLFELAGETDDLGYVTGAYRLQGDDVTDEW